MKLVTYVDNGAARLGAILGDRLLLDLAAAARRRGADPAPYGSMLALIQSGGGALGIAREMADSANPDDCRPLNGLLSPLPLPEQIRDFANYELHVRQALNSSMRLRASRSSDPDAELARLQASGLFAIPDIWYRRPFYYKCNRFSVVGPDAEIEWPAFSGFMDYELELAVVIGRKVRDVSPQEAMDAVFGYTIYNDFSARDMQAEDTSFRMGPAKGKDFDSGNAMGPCIVTADEIADPYALRMSVHVNGECRMQGISGGMQHDIAACISFVSRSETLHPGEVLAMGTVGNGCGYESLRSLEDGDVVELEVEGIGRLRNRVSKR